MILGLDIGGTNIKGGVVTTKGRVVRSVSIPSDTKRGAKKFLAALARAIELLNPKDCSALGLGCPGPLDQKRGLILETPNLPLHNFPIRQYCAQRYHLPTTIDNDANAFVLAEATYGAGKRCRSVVGLTIGTGIGGGIVINKIIERGRGNAGELGYVHLSMGGPRGRLGDRGTLQEYLRGKGQKTLLQKLKLQDYPSKNLELLARKSTKNAARRYWHIFGERLGLGLATIVHVLDPDIIVLGGQISKAFSLFRPSLYETLKERAIFTPPRVVRGHLGDHAGIIGAALLTQQ